METHRFRIIGLVYIVFCWMFSTLGVIYSFLYMLLGIPFCSNILCYDDNINTYMVAACLVFLILSAISVAFVKGGIEDGNPSYIRIFRVLAILRNCALAALWSYQYVILEKSRIHGDPSFKVSFGEHITLGLLAGTTVINCLELWILNGILRLTKLKLVEEAIAP